MATISKSRDPIKKVGLRLIRQHRTGMCENEQVPSGNISTQGSASSQRQILWDHKPRSCVIFKRWKTLDASEATLAIAEWLKQEHGFRIMIYIPDGEMALPTDTVNHRKNCNLLELYERYIPQTDADLMICLGGDGTVLYASSLFPKAMPPMMSIAMGSLGFLTPLEFEHYKIYLNEIITKCWSPSQPKLTKTRPKSEPSSRGRMQSTAGTMSPLKRPAASISAGDMDLNPLKRAKKPVPVETSLDFGVAVTLRMRLTCKIFRRQNNDDMPTFEKELPSLNEVLVEKGSFTSLVTLDILVNGEFLTTALADGIIIATPTGSTAYNLSAGGPLICPSVPAIALTPICPHTLSFRPILLPDSAEIIIKVSKSARGCANVCVDGGEHYSLKKGEYIAVSMSNWPMPTLEVPRYLCFPNKTAAQLAAFPNEKSNESDAGVKENTLVLTSEKESKGACSLNIKTQSFDITPKNRKSDDVACNIPVSSLDTYEPESSRTVECQDQSPKSPTEAGHRDHQISCWIDAITEKLGWNHRDIQKSLTA